VQQVEIRESGISSSESLLTGTNSSKQLWNHIIYMQFSKHRLLYWIQRQQCECVEPEDERTSATSFDWQSLRARPPRTRLTPLRRRRALLIYSLCIFHSVKNMSDEYCVAVIIFMRSEVLFLLLSGVKTSFNVGFGRRGNYWTSAMFLINLTFCKRMRVSSCSPNNCARLVDILSIDWCRITTS